MLPQACNTGKQLMSERARPLLRVVPLAAGRAPQYAGRSLAADQRHPCIAAAPLRSPQRPQQHSTMRRPLCALALILAASALIAVRASGDDPTVKLSGVTDLSECLARREGQPACAAANSRCAACSKGEGALPCPHARGQDARQHGAAGATTTAPGWRRRPANSGSNGSQPGSSSPPLSIACRSTP